MIFSSGSVIAIPGIHRLKSVLRQSVLLMDIESVRKFCLSLPHVTEGVQWENDLLMRIGNKMFCVLSLEPESDHCMSFKCTPEKFADLVEQEGIMPAPYVARYHWVALERFDALPERELKSLLTTAYELVRNKLPKKVRDTLSTDSKKAVKASTSPQSPRKQRR
ncbi:MAG TPA: MmcQ/YjbR family DNA-binding protein [Pyrinomonadaceae bacterium]|nr:MmcQ/YjbR family DNA-binding protein [Pyrinomonadaceae bacterium]